MEQEECLYLSWQKKLNWDETEKRKKNEKLKDKYLQATLLAATIAGTSARGRGGGWGWKPGSMSVVNHPLGSNQCAYHREEGHWKNECPKKKPVTQGGSIQQADLIMLGTSDSGWWGPAENIKIYMPIVGVTGKQALKPFLKLTECKTGGKVLSHEFLYMPECLIPLLEWDFICKLRAQ